MSGAEWIIPAVIAAVGAGASYSQQNKAQKSAKSRADDARRQQQEALAQEEAATNRLQLETDKRETELSSQAASQRRAVAAQRRGRGGLAYTPSTSGLKSTLGG